MRTLVGGSTYLGEVLDLIVDSGAHYDNVILLSDGDCYNSFDKSFKLVSNQWDETITKMMKVKVIKKFFLDNLTGNSFAVINTDDFRKNLITGFSEKVIEVINIYSALGHDASDVRKVIDSMVSALHE
jgi:2-oxoglutarate dehydrogenase complex dehydrogenase (E1) component-like enzyme